MEPVRESETKFTSAFVAFSFLSSFRSYYLLNSEELSLFGSSTAQ